MIGSSCFSNFAPLKFSRDEMARSNSLLCKSRPVLPRRNQKSILGVKFIVYIFGLMVVPRICALIRQNAVSFSIYIYREVVFQGFSLPARPSTKHILTTSSDKRPRGKGTLLTFLSMMKKTAIKKLSLKIIWHDELSSFVILVGLYWTMLHSRMQKLKIKRWPKAKAFLYNAFFPFLWVM